MKRKKMIWLPIAVVSVFLLVLAAYLLQMSQAPKAVKDMPVAQPEKAVQAAAIIKKGEGIEHALIRQLIANPTGYEGERKPELIKKWAQREAHLIAISLGFVQYKNGQIAKEIRVKGDGGDTAYVLLKKEGEWIVEKYSKAKGEFQASPDFTASAQEIESQFCVDIEGCFQPYEYVHNTKGVNK